MIDPRRWSLRAILARTGPAYPRWVTALAVGVCAVASTVGQVYIGATVHLDPKADLTVAVGAVVGFGLAALYFVGATRRDDRVIADGIAGGPAAPAWEAALLFGDRLVRRVLIASAIGTVVPVAAVVASGAATDADAYAHGLLAAVMVAGLEVVLVRPVARAAMVPVLAALKAREPGLRLDAAGGIAARSALVRGFFVVNLVTVTITATLVAATRDPDAEPFALAVPALVGLAATTGVLWLHVGLLLDPLDRLLAGVSRIGRDTAWRAGVLGAGEAGRLGEAFDAMLDRLDAAQRELLEHERVLAHAQRMESLGMLTAGVAHEVRNPLTTLRLSVTSLRDAANRLRGISDADRAELHDTVDDMTSAIARIGAIVDQLRLHARKDVEASEPFDLAELVRECLPLARTSNPAARVDLDLTPGVTVIAPREGVRQILLNLLTNALQAVAQRSGATVTVRVVAGGLVEVRDAGPGVAPEHRDQLFRPFFTTKPAESGTGLGLYVSRTIARSAGGDICFVDDPAATVFQVTLPTPPR